MTTKHTEPLHVRFPHLTTSSKVYAPIKKHCEDRGLKINRFLDDFDAEMIEIYRAVIKNRKNGRILDLTEDLIRSIWLINKFFDFTLLEGFLYQQFEEETDLTERVGKKNFQTLLSLAKIGMDTPEGNMLLKLNEVKEEVK